MDMLEGRIREVLASVLSKGAKALERTAEELEQAASEMLRKRGDEGEDADRVWSEQPRREPDRMIRSAPLRAVPDTPVDEDHSTPDTDETPAWTPPTAPPQTPDRERPGAVDAAFTTSPEVAGSPEGTASSRLAGPLEPDADARVADIAAGTVAQARARLDELTIDELRHLRAVETAGRNRTTLISAIDRSLED